MQDRIEWYGMDEVQANKIIYVAGELQGACMQVMLNTPVVVTLMPNDGALPIIGQGKKNSIHAICVSSAETLISLDDVQAVHFWAPSGESTFRVVISNPATRSKVNFSGTARFSPAGRLENMPAWPKPR